MDHLSIPLWGVPILFLTGLVAGLVDAVAGGGGLITLPVLLGLGLPPPYALGTNKLQSSFGSTSAVRHFARSGTIRLGDGAAGVAFTAAGAALGAWAVQRLDPALLRQAIPFLLATIALYTLVTPHFGFEDRRPRVQPGPFYSVFGLGLGFYDGFFGPGTGSFWVVALVAGLGLDLVRATGYAKLMNCTSNLISLGVFLAGGHVVLTAGLLMGSGQMIGARIGAGLVVTRGARFVRPLFLTMVLAVTAKLFYDGYR
ncbi:MAG: TSUP family transporter [Deltaproteobacteria bacterium]|nr:TSUP family transporter [Deltaproteobacteria bacterium]